MIRIGFTGTRRGLTGSQQARLMTLLQGYVSRYLIVELHHGQCIGADEETARMAKTLGCRIVSHPPTDRKAISTFAADEYRTPMPYLQRNHDIVDETKFLIATPGEPVEQLRSGTWSTIRYFRQRRGVEPTILIPMLYEAVEFDFDAPPRLPKGAENVVIDHRLGSL